MKRPSARSVLHGLARLCAASLFVAVCVSLTRADEVLASAAGTSCDSASSSDASVVTSDSAPAQTVPDDATLERNGATIGSIIIRPETIFESEDGTKPNFAFRVTNALHVRTRESTVRQQLTFREGDRYSRSALAESERILRRSGYLYDASVRPVRYEGNAVTVEVSTRDTWTTKAGLGFKSAGGTTSTHFGLAETNFLGLGKQLEVRRTSNVDRVQTLFTYGDRNVGGTHLRMEAAYANNSDGTLQGLTFGRPFYSLDTRWAAGGLGRSEDRTDSLYALGNITNQFGHHLSILEGYYGLSPGLVNGGTRRLTFGFTKSTDHFEPLATPGATVELPEDRNLAYPWVGFDVTRDGFIRARDMDKIGRTEDLNLSHEFHARLGFSSTAFGADRNEAIVEAAYRTGLNPGNGQILLLGAGVSGRFTGSAINNGLTDVSLRYYNRSSEKRLFYIGIVGRAGANLDLDQQLLLGGDNGLRGYPLRYALGERTALITIEERFYRDKEVWKLFKLGAAVFADAGEAWGGPPSAASRLDVLKDVGFGLRLGLTRTAHAGMLRIDVAFPINADPSLKSAMFNISTGETF